MPGRTQAAVADPQAAFELDYQNDEWTCPITGAGPVPKTLEANLVYRRNLGQQAQNDSELQSALLAVCAASPLYFFNVFGWTYRPKVICADGIERSAGSTWTDDGGDEQTVPPADVPIITWPAQDEFVTELVASMRQGGRVLGPKSREQGATMLVMGICTWGLLFWPRFSALCVSRREDLVDNGSEDSLFGKVDFVVSKLPGWMVAPRQIRRTSKPIKAVNPAIGSWLVGESANVDVGQSRRVTLAFVDEAARFPHGGRMMKSLASVAACTALVSTPNGPGTEFSRLCEKAETAAGRKRMKLLTLSYADSPTHGRGRRWTLDDDGSITGKKENGFWETPAFALARAESVSPKDWRENWLCDHDTSGLLVLNSNAIAKLRRGVKRPKIGMVVEDTELTQLNGWRPPDVLAKSKLRFEETQRGRLSVWELPRLDTTYVMGWDLSQGVERSNTIGAVMDRQTGIVVAEYADPSLDPFEAVPIATQLGAFYRGQRRAAYLIYEVNGPGMGFGHELVRQGYPSLYYQHRERDARDRETKRWGWTSTPGSRDIAFDALNKALCSGTFTTYSEAGLDDLAQWVFDEHGRIVCGALRDETTGAQARHGDRAIAYMLCVKGVRFSPRYFEPPAPIDKPGTYGYVLDHETTWREIAQGVYR